MSEIITNQGSSNPRRQSKVLKWALIIGIVIVLNLFFNYAISLVYPSPQYEKFCPNEQVISPPTSKKECVAIGGQWTENTYPVDGPVKTMPAGQEVKGYCNPNYTCQKNLETMNKSYQRNVFITLVLLGIASIIVGIFVQITDAVSVAFSLGGVLSLVIASIRYWSEAGNLLKVILLAVALGALIWVGIKKFRE